MIDGVYQRRWPTSAGPRVAWYVVRGARALSLKTGAWSALHWWASMPGEWVFVRALTTPAEVPTCL